MCVPIYSSGQLKWKLSNRPMHLITKATEKNELDDQQSMNLLRIQLDKLWSPTLDGDVNFSRRTKMNSKTSILQFINRCITFIEKLKWASQNTFHVILKIQSLKQHIVQPKTWPVRYVIRFEKVLKCDIKSFRCQNQSAGDNAVKWSIIFMLN